MRLHVSQWGHHVTQHSTQVGTRNWLLRVSISASAWTSGNVQNQHAKHEFWIE